MGFPVTENFNKVIIFSKVKAILVGATAEYRGAERLCTNNDWLTDILAQVLIRAYPELIGCAAQDICGNPKGKPTK